MTSPGSRPDGAGDAADPGWAEPEGFGTWLDGEGGPEYRVAIPPAGPDLVLPEGGAGQAWHLVGSPGLAVLAHVSGRVTLYATAAGMVRLADRTAALRIDGTPVDPDEVRFGIRCCTWTYVTDRWVVGRRLSARPDEPVLDLSWTVTRREGDGDGEVGTVLEESWEMQPVPLVPSPLMSRRVPVPSTHRGIARAVWPAAFAVSGAFRRLTDRARGALGRRRPLRAEADATRRRITWSPDRARTRPAGPRRWMASPPSIELRVARPPDGVTAETGSPTIRVAIGPAAAPTVDLAAEVRLVDALVPRPTPEDGPIRAVGVADRQLAREACWHVDQLRGLRVPDPWTGGRFVMQGSAYAFVHGLHGAVRDEAFVVAALVAADPATARDVLVSMATMARPDGTFHYAHFGYGAVASGGVHAAPTDLPLFFLWAVAEYVTVTGDHAVLDTSVPRRGTRSGGVTTVGEAALAAAGALDDHVGVGPHGLLRVGSGDWVDPISLMVRRRRAFHRHGESGFNSGMALAVLPGAARVLERLDPAAAARCRELCAELDRALEGSWTGRWYLRGWDGRGGPIGRDHCFLDAQVWPLIAGHGPAERRAGLVATMGRLLDDPSPIGPTIIDRPHRVRLGLLADGWDCNGGVWAALGGLAVWATAPHDPDRAWRMLRRMSFAGQATAYPNIWYGQWSGPDARNSTMGDRPGETFVHPATPMTEFPVMNSNAHAGPLLGSVKLLAVTA